MLDQMYLTNVHTAFQPKQHTTHFFSSAHITFSRIDHLLDHKVSLGKFMKTEVISNIFSDHNSYEIRNKVQEKNCNKHKCMAAEQHAAKPPMGPRKKFRGNKITLRDKQKLKHNGAKLTGCSKSSSERDDYSSTMLPQETRVISNKLHNLTPKTSRERRTTKSPVSRRKEIIKIIAEINEIETKQSKRSMKLKAGSFKR